MDITAAIALAAGISGLVTALWKVFNIIRELERKIEEVENQFEIQIYTINGIKERLEHTRDRVILEVEGLKERVNHNEAWLTKHTAFEPRSKR